MTKIELYRRMKGLSQIEEARQLGVTPSIIVHIERGYRKPYPKIRKQLAAFFGVEETELFAPDGWPLQVELEEVIGR